VEAKIRNKNVRAQEGARDDQGRKRTHLFIRQTHHGRLDSTENTTLASFGNTPKRKYYFLSPLLISFPCCPRRPRFAFRCWLHCCRRDALRQHPAPSLVFDKKAPMLSCTQDDIRTRSSFVVTILSGDWLQATDLSIQPLVRLGPPFDRLD